MLDTAPKTIEELREVLLLLKKVSKGALLLPLTGGVSSLIAHVFDGSDEWVVKTPLQRLAVADEWTANRSRSGHEAAALRFFGGNIGPVFTPTLRFYDTTSLIIGEQFFPGPPPTYKDMLLSGVARPDVSTALGVALTKLQQLSAPPDISGNAPRVLFNELRLEPFYLTTANELPRLHDDLVALTEETRSEQRCMVHGDFTPKNVLVDHNRTVLLDWEGVHVGDPAFDPATLIAHLTLKALRGVSSEICLATVLDARRFSSSYEGAATPERVLRHIGALMLSRMYGKSRVDYLETEHARNRVYEVAVASLRGELSTFDDFFGAVTSTSLRQENA
jgi:hypothetical protein